MPKLYVSNKDESVRMFRSDFMELFTKVHFTIPLILYLPVVGYSCYRTLSSEQIGWMSGAGLFLAGIFAWTITEYVMHRYVFHFHPKAKWAQRLHFIMHGVHHDYPNDSMRLVLPPAVSIPLALFFYFTFRALLGEELVFPFFAGFVLGYLFYDMLHYSVHHVNSNNKIFVALKTHHLKHHFKDPDKGFGVSSPLWDLVARSEFSASKTPE